MSRGAPANAMAEIRQTFDSTATTLNAMNGMQFLPIDRERLAAMRAQGMDEQGNPWTLRPAEGWEPLRCCLRKASAGEEIALICYSPWTQPSPWQEAGPVFVHFGACEGYSATGHYPPAFRDSPSMLNPFDHTGARAYAHITLVAPEDDHEAAVRAVMAQPEVAFLHVRSSLAGCLTFEVQPADR